MHIVRGEASYKKVMKAAPAGANSVTVCELLPR